MKKNFTILPRTDFHSIYLCLSPKAQTAFKSARQNFIDEFPFAKQSTLGYDLDQFYQSIHDPQDQRTFKTEQRNVDKLSSLQTYKTSTDESIGMMPVDSQDKQKVIMEFRHITGGILIPFDMFKTAVMQPIFDWVKQINNE